MKRDTFPSTGSVLKAKFQDSNKMFAKKAFPRGKQEKNLKFTPFFVSTWHTRPTNSSVKRQDTKAIGFLGRDYAVPHK